MKTGTTTVDIFDVGNCKGHSQRIISRNTRGNWEVYGVNQDINGKFVSFLAKKIVQASITTVHLLQFRNKHSYAGRIAEQQCPQKRQACVVCLSWLPKMTTKATTRDSRGDLLKVCSSEGSALYLVIKNPPKLYNLTELGQHLTLGL